LGCEIAIFDGDVGIRGANVAPSYASDDRRPIADSVTGWYLTGDAGHIDTDGYLYITGRLNELINVGGVKVAPCDAELALLTHPAVVDAVAFSLPHPTLGEHVAAAVVLHPDLPVTMTQLIEHTARLLPRAAVPFAVYPVGAIERDASGKVQRRELTTRFTRKPYDAQAESSLTGDDSSLHAIAHIWEDVLEYAFAGLSPGRLLRRWHRRVRGRAPPGISRIYGRCRHAHFEFRTECVAGAAVDTDLALGQRDLETRPDDCLQSRA
jgi:hypothetical protein